MESAYEQGAWLAQHRVVLEQLGVSPDTFRSFEGHAATKRRPQPKIIGSNNVEPVQEAFSRQSNAVREDPGWLRSPETAHRIEGGSALRRHSRAPGVDDERTLSSDESRSSSTDRDTLDSSELDSDWTMDTFDDDESYEADEALATAAEREAVFWAGALPPRRISETGYEQSSGQLGRSSVVNGDWLALPLMVTDAESCVWHRNQLIGKYERMRGISMPTAYRQYSLWVASRTSW
jgi:hypothetical protein